MIAVERFLASFSLVHYLVFATFIHAIFSLRWKNELHRYALIILASFSLNEIVSTYQIICGLDFKLNYMITTIIHTIMWLSILRKSVSFPRTVSGLSIAFATFSVCDLLLIEGWKIFNVYSFIVGALLYLMIFLVESFYQLKKENFSFFFCNEYILLSSPVLFFIGLSFMFGFRSKSITNTILFSNFDLYETIMITVNIVYYALFNLYIYREKRKLYEF